MCGRFESPRRSRTPSWWTGPDAVGWRRCRSSSRSIFGATVRSLRALFALPRSCRSSRARRTIPRRSARRARPPAEPTARRRRAALSFFAARAGRRAEARLLLAALGDYWLLLAPQALAMILFVARAPRHWRNQQKSMFGGGVHHGNVMVLARPEKFEDRSFEAQTSAEPWKDQRLKGSC